MVKEHPTNLAAFVSGRLNESDTQTVLDHLAECDHCLTAVDTLWPNLDEQLGPALGPPLPDERAAMLESRLVERMQRTNLGARILWFSTQGFVRVALAFLEPFLGKSQASRRSTLSPPASDGVHND